MEKIMGYDESPAFTGEGLPKGKYVCVIKGAGVRQAKSGKSQFVLFLDIADGAYKGHFSERYNQDVKKNGQDAKWAATGTFRQGYGGKQLPFFKGMMTAIEESNDGFFWGQAKDGSGRENWDENTLIGKRVGVVFGREQYRAENDLRWSVKPVKIRSIQGLENEEIPEDKPLDDFTSAGFTPMGMINEDDLPF